MLFGCYRRTEAADPDGYVAGIAIVLTLYPDELIREVTDPRTGIMNDERYMSFMPNTGELKVYCEGIQARQARLDRLGSLAKPLPESHRLPPPEPQPGDLATVFVPDAHPRYALLVEKAKDKGERFFYFGKSSDGRNGIWISWDVWDDGRPGIKAIGHAAKSVAA